MLRDDHFHFLLGYIDDLYKVASGSVYVSLAHSRKNNLIRSSRSLYTLEPTSFSIFVGFMRYAGCELGGAQATSNCFRTWGMGLAKRLFGYDTTVC